MRKADITVEVVSCLVAKQFPQWTDLEIRPVALDGWDNTTFRLGEGMSVRLPSHKMYLPQIDKEHRWLPVLAPQLPVPIPHSIAKGAPGCGFPAPWSIYRWLQGEPAALVRVTDHDRLAEDLGAFLAALQSVDADGGPPPGEHSFNRGGPVSAWDEQTRATIRELADMIDVAGATEVWEAAVGHDWTAASVWAHGDVTGSNLLLSDDRLCGVIDFGCSSVGDPACSSIPAAEGDRRAMYFPAIGNIANLACSSSAGLMSTGWFRGPRPFHSANGELVLGAVSAPCMTSQSLGHAPIEDG